MSTVTVDEFLKLINNHLEQELLNDIISTGNFSLLADETADMTDRAILSVSIRYVDPVNNQVKEVYLGLVETQDSKGAEALCQKICKVLCSKSLDIKQLFFHGLDATNAMSDERSGLQRRLRHEAPHSKYVNCRNNRLALVFVPQFKQLREVDATVLALWKASKYPSIKASIFNSAQEAEGLEKLKLLKASLARWLSHGAATLRIINRSESVINSLDEIIHNKNDPGLMGIRTQLLEQNNVLFLLLFADVLQPVNRFSMFLQTRNLVFNSVNAKLNQLMENLRDISENDGYILKKTQKAFFILHTTV